MLMITFICLLALCVISGTFYSISGYKLNALNVAIKMFAPLCCALLAVVNANLSSAVGGFSMFVIIGLIFLVCSEAFSFLPEKTVVFDYAQNIFLALGYACFAAGSLLHGAFNPFALGFGLFAALAIMLISLALNDKKTLHFWISNAITLGCLALFLAQGVALIVQNTHLFASILYLGAAALIMASKACQLFSKGQSKLTKILSSALNILGLIAVASCIYFM